MLLLMPSYPSCRLWRDIALRTPALWSLIHLHWPKDVIQRFLERSGNYSLKVVIPRMVLSYGEAPDHLLRNLFLRANELVAFDESLDDGGNTWVSVPTPRLRRLDLSVDRAHGTGSLLIESIGTPPAELEHLELNCVNLLSAFSSCSKLQTLVLKGDVSATVEDWERFFDVAAQLPHLYNLSLVNKSFPLLGMDRVFELKSIHSLTIQSSKFEASIVALSTLVLPNLSFISVHFPEWKISSWYTLMLLLPRWKHVSCKFHIENWHGLDIELCEDKDLPFRTVHLAFDKVDGRIESRNEQAWINTCLRHRAFQSIPFHNISGIWLDGISISPWTGDMLLAFLKNFTPLLIPSTTTPSVNVPITPNEVVNRLGTFETGRAFDRLHLRFGRQESPQLEEADGEAPQDERTLTIWGSYIWNENSRLRV
ncbi:hypothetical protein SISSUDRAFT_890177 [Sistotremastrum suecicum HHB10207 ss-3]|uniref:F-box domain-containing protein n=1 Tax=Sistotremastrum suecicum HHB10207 ss-3 TaxID=1314776 RepID=A0A166C4K8_9AGAM|nr:hypothetical protein SISSUDRAFT_890177 [Sistotremastrum suecicum HHB10207 ss-3]